MPVVHRGDGDGIDFFSLQQFFVIFEQRATVANLAFWRPAAGFFSERSAKPPLHDIVIAAPAFLLFRT